jgi:DNA transformation protein
MDRAALDAATAQALELLADFGPVTSRRMFGGAGLYLDGVMFALIADEVLHLKADADLAAALAAEGSVPFVYAGKRKPVTMSYWRLPEAALDDPEAACAWAARALTVARAAKR